MSHVRFLAITVLLASAPGLADPADDARQVFMLAVDDHVALITATEPAAERAVSAQQTGARATAIDDGNVATLPKLAALAFKTDLDGTEAGVSIAPLVLLGHTGEAARGLSVSIASLKEDKFRVGASYRSLRASAIGPDDLGLKLCELDPAVYRTEVAKRADDYAALCVGISKLPMPSVAPHKVAWLRAAAACGRQVDDNLLREVLTLYSGGTATGDKVFKDAQNGNLTSKVSSALQFWNDIKPTVPPVAANEVPPETIEHLKVLRNAPSRWSCYDRDAIVKAALWHHWASAKTSLGFSIVGDFHPYRFGLNPDENDDPSKNKPLPRGELAKAEARIELHRSRKRLTWTVGLGAKWEREAIDDDLTLSLRPAVGMQYVLTRLDGGPLEKEGEKEREMVLTEDGTPPPVLVLGVEALFGAAVHNKPTSQSSRLDEVDLKLFADFRISKEIAFRIGIPLTAEIKTREAAAGVAEKKALQWTVPVFLSTVLEI